MIGGSYRYKVDVDHDFRKKALKKRSDVIKAMIQDGVIVKGDRTYKSLLKPNYAYLTYDIEGKTGEIIAHSSVNWEEDAGKLKEFFIPLKNVPLFKHLRVGSCRNVNYKQDPLGTWDRDIDTEAKLLEEIREKFGDNPLVNGEIRLYTHYEPCLSCDYEIIQFMEFFQNIKMFIYFHQTYTKDMEVS